MIKKVFIVGIRGNMGKRYKAILDYLNVEVTGLDIGDKLDDYNIAYSEGIIIATPTDLHVDHVYFYSKYGLPILCEKPIGRNIDRVERLVSFCRDKGVNLQVVNQYIYAGNTLGNGPTYYNYYNSGRDGLYYDLISIIGLAVGKIVVENTSPIWTCEINGNRINRGNIDDSYINMIIRWLANPQPNLDFILMSQHKVLELIKAHEESSNRLPGPEHIY